MTLYDYERPFGEAVNRDEMDAWVRKPCPVLVTAEHVQADPVLMNGKRRMALRKGELWWWAAVAVGLVILVGRMM